MTDKPRDYYEVFGVRRDATEEQIKQAYRKLARKYHPDVSEESDAKERFQELQSAYETLKDADKRKVYDETGRVDNTTMLENQAREGIAQYVLQWIQNHAESGVDLRRWLVDKLAQEEMQAVANQQEGERVLAKTQKTLKRVSYKGSGKDVVRMVLEQRVENLTQGIKIAQDNVARVRLARRFVDDYEFMPDPDPPPVTTYTFGSPYVLRRF